MALDINILASLFKKTRLYKTQIFEIWNIFYVLRSVSFVIFCEFYSSMLIKIYNNFSSNEQKLVKNTNICKYIKAKNRLTPRAHCITSVSFLFDRRTDGRVTRQADAAGVAVVISSLTMSSIKFCCLRVSQNNFQDYNNIILFVLICKNVSVFESVYIRCKIFFFDIKYNEVEFLI